MTDAVAELADRARGLTAEERSRLVELLVESLHEPVGAEVEAAWNAELERRVAAYKRGEVTTFSSDEVFAEARKIAP